MWLLWSVFGHPRSSLGRNLQDSDRKNKSIMLNGGNPKSGQTVPRIHLGKVNASLLGDCPNNKYRFRKKESPRENLEVTRDVQESRPRNEMAEPP